MGDEEFGVYYDTLNVVDDIEVYEDGTVVIETNDYSEIYTTLENLVALIKRVQAWREARKVFVSRESEQ